jgi:hypothetical protein
MLKYIHLALLLLLLGRESEASANITFNLGAENKYGTGTIQSTACNKDTQIDFYFSSSGTLSSNSSSTLGHSTLKFMDVNGVDLDLNLNVAGVSTSSDVNVIDWTIN